MSQFENLIEKICLLENWEFAVYLQIYHYRMRFETCTVESQNITVNRMYLVGTQSRHLRSYVFGVLTQECLILMLLRQGSSKLMHLRESRTILKTRRNISGNLWPISDLQVRKNKTLVIVTYNGNYQDIYLSIILTNVGCKNLSYYTVFLMTAFNFFALKLEVNSISSTLASWIILY